MKSKATIVIRVLLGLIFFVFGLAGLLNLIPPPENIPERLMTFTQGLMASMYFFPLLKLVETICGLLLITGFFVPLALVILAPIVLNIFLTHAFLAPEGLVLATVMGLFMIYLAFFSEPYSGPIKNLFRPKVR